MNEHSTDHHSTPARPTSRRGNRTGRRIVIAGLSVAWIAGIATLMALGSTAAAAG
jgi:hypothetical protein